VPGPEERIMTATYPFDVFSSLDDFDLELIEHRTLDGHIQELVYRPTRQA
jgi:hypothetical protein